MTRLELAGAGRRRPGGDVVLGAVVCAAYGQAVIATTLAIYALG
ncbi:antitermination protein NusB, partial [Mycolicibacterium vaccae]|nr:antitermination protein NusB [Mycolicibacterium vaccae]